MPSGSLIASASGSVQSKSDCRRNEASPSPTTPVANDILVQRRRNKKTAVRFFRRLRKGQGREPRWLVTDKLRNDDAAHRAVMPTVEHSNAAYANTRADVSHQPTRHQEYHRRGFASSIQVQRFLTRHGLTQNLCRLGRHLMQAGPYRFVRTQAFEVWKDSVCA